MTFSFVVLATLKSDMCSNLHEKHPYNTFRAWDVSSGFSSEAECCFRGARGAFYLWHSQKMIWTFLDVRSPEPYTLNPRLLNPVRQALCAASKIGVSSA